MKNNDLNFKSPELNNLILFEPITNEYFRLGVGPYTDEAKKEIFERLIETEYEYKIVSKSTENLINDYEILEIKKIWSKSSMDINFIDDILEKYGREKVEMIQDSFDIINSKYEMKLKKKLNDHGLDYSLLNKLVLKEKDLLAKDNRKEILKDISSIFNSDSINF